MAALPRLAATIRGTSLLLMLLLDVASAALRGAGPCPDVGRRGAIAAATSALVAAAPLSSPASTSASDERTASQRKDPYTHTSFFGLAPPPISGQWSRDQLVAEARSGHLASMQIAPQHDCVFAVTTAGRRYVCMVRDEDFPSLLLDAMGPDGTYAFEVLPMDAGRAAVRSSAGGALKCALAVAAADFLGLLPWDTTPYGSLAQRDQAAGQRRPPKRYKSLLPAAQRLVRLLRPGIDRSAPPSVSEADSDEALRDNALRLVLGLASAEEAALIKQRLKRKAQRIKAEHEPDWVTPLTADGFQNGKLPTLEQLFVRPFRVAHDGAWAQYIKAQPPGEQPPRHATAPSLAPLTPPRDPGAAFDAGDLGMCRLCPDFTELYGHNIYICKQRVVA